MKAASHSKRTFKILTEQDEIPNPVVLQYSIKLGQKYLWKTKRTNVFYQTEDPAPENCLIKCYSFHMTSLYWPFSKEAMLNYSSRPCTEISMEKPLEPKSRALPVRYSQCRHKLDGPDFWKAASCVHVSLMFKGWSGIRQERSEECLEELRKHINHVSLLW